MIFNNPHFVKRLQIMISTLIVATYGCYIVKTVDSKFLAEKRYEDVKNKYTTESNVSISDEKEMEVNDTLVAKVDLNDYQNEIDSTFEVEESILDEALNEPSDEIKNVFDNNVAIEEEKESSQFKVIKKTVNEDALNKLNASILEFRSLIKQLFDTYSNTYNQINTDDSLYNESEVLNENILEYESVYDDEIVYNMIDESTEEVEEDALEEVKEEVVELSSELLDSGYEFKNIDWEGLKEENADTCAWLESGNIIDYPVVQGEDNDYYLHHDFTKKKSSSGTLFVDAYNSKVNDGEFDQYTVIYGHNLKNGKIFGTIDHYISQEYFDNNQFGVIYTPSGRVFKVEYFASCVVDANNPISIDTSSCDEELIFNNYMQIVKENSKIQSDVEVNYGDNILVLTSCISNGVNNRINLYGKLVEQKTKYYDKQYKKTF